jgi:hypothetical protein
MHTPDNTALTVQSANDTGEEVSPALEGVLGGEQRDVEHTDVDNNAGRDGVSMCLVASSVVHSTAR